MIDTFVKISFIFSAIAVGQKAIAVSVAILEVPVILENASVMCSSRALRLSL